MTKQLRPELVRPTPGAIIIALIVAISALLGYLAAGAAHDAPRVGILSTTKVNNLEASGTVVAAGNTTIGGTGVSPNGGTARLSVITPDLGTEIGATPWSNKWTTFGNFGSLTSEGLGIGWSATNNEAVIASSAPSGAWKGLHTEAATYAFRVAGGASSGCTIDSSSNFACAGSLSASGTAAVIESGTGTPEGAVTAPVGSVFLRTNGSTGTTEYIKESGAGNTGWVAVASGGVSDGDKGDITVSSSGTVWTIDNNVVTYAKMQDVTANNRVIGAVTAGDPVELTGTQVTAMLDAVTTSAKGVVPTAPNVATQYFDGTGNWSTPATGAVTQDVYELANTGATWNKPGGAKVVEVTVIGGGGGGAGGRQGAAGNNRPGGGGGGGAFVAHAMFYGTDAPSSAVITVGAGGTGGGAGSPGTAGGSSDFGGRIVAFGGGLGQSSGAGTTSGGGGGGGGAGQGGAGSGTSNNGGSPASTAAIGLDINGMSGGLSPPGYGVWGGAGGGRGNVGIGAASNNGGFSLYGGAGGGGGGQVNSNNTAENAGNGGSSGSVVSITGGGGGRGATDTGGGDGIAFGPYAGGAGGGGGSAVTAGHTAGNGGKGYIGCGGGGGGAAGASATAGSGGNGGDGRVIVTTYF